MSRKQRRKLRAAMGAPSKGFSTKRGRDYFVAGFVIMPIVVALTALGGAPISFAAAVALVLGISIVAGIFGMFTDNIGL